MKIGAKLQLAVIVIVSVIVAVVVSAAGFFGVRQAYANLNKENGKLALSVAHNSEYGTLSANQSLLDPVLEGVMLDKDILYCQIVDNQGTVLAAKIREHGPVPSREFSAPIITRRAMTSVEDSSGLNPDVLSGREETIGTAYIGVSLVSLRRQITNLIMVTVFIFLITGIIASLIFSATIKRMVIQPIDVLIKATRRVAEGDLEHQVPVHANDELGSLAGAFNKMTQNLKDTTVSKDYTDNIIKSMLSSLIVADQNGIIHNVNQAAEEMLKYSAADLIGKPLTLIMGDKELVRYPTFGNGHDQDFLDTVETTCVTKDRRNIPVLFSSSVMRDKHDKLLGVVCVARDITDRKRAEDELQDNFQKLQKILTQTVTTLASAVEMRDPYTAGHQRRVTQLAVALAAAMSLPEDIIRGLNMAAIIHDIGKLNVPAEILSRPSRLTVSEYTLIKVHSEMGYKILKTIEFPWPVADIVLQHHERLDGSGYPNGLKSDKILLQSKILALADVVEAMSSHRPYRPAFTLDVTLEEVKRNAGVLYDPRAVAACVGLFKEKNFQFT
jgi:PAS domain S-box-containing protein/putative nucleotidyltransferase with HDIG domain